jgi:hypothetical protein
MSTYDKLARIKREFTRIFTEGGTTYKIEATAKLTDGFSLTGMTWRKAPNGLWVEERGGCIHDEIAQHFPEMEPYIKWHLCGLTEPMHYVANTLWHAGDKDCHGLRKGERRQIVNGRTGVPCWELVAVVDGVSMPIHELKRYVDSITKPENPPVLEWAPWDRVGEGKERDLDAARSTAIWPEATDEELTAPDLKERLEARLPTLMDEFHRAMSALFDKEATV